MLTGIDIEGNELSLNIFLIWSGKLGPVGMESRKKYLTYENLQCWCLKRHIFANDFHNEKMFIPSVKLKWEDQ